ncbi:MAG: hypothetical protein M4579_004703 [Chaenotheca gracillima]|nr:MAG: hypothetical protein M4579_004703 [Chaenotheca gracillima]
MVNQQPYVDVHERFTAWAIEQGVQINKVAPKYFQNRGVGMVATDKIQAGEGLTKVPPTALVTAYSVPQKIKDTIGTCTVHGLLTADLCLDAQKRNSSWQAWRSVWPSEQSFSTIPLNWTPELQSMLPFAAAGTRAPALLATGSKHKLTPDLELLQNQKQKLSADYATVSKAFPNIDEVVFRYHWLLVNTRSFYYLKPGVKKKPARDDCMALCPFSDYFNHADTGCPVTFGADGITISSDKNYDVGDEIYVSYGNHSNDFLLTECKEE